MERREKGLIREARGEGRHLARGLRCVEDIRQTMSPLDPSPRQRHKPTFICHVQLRVKADEAEGRVQVTKLKMAESETTGRFFCACGR